MSSFFVLLLALGCQSVTQYTVSVPTKLQSAPKVEVGEPLVTEKFVRSDVAFRCGDDTCAAWLYQPVGTDEPPPVVVMAHGFTGQRDMGLAAYGERFAEAGVASFVFDYRYWGDSGGEPRYFADFRSQLDDYDAAIAHVRTLESVDAERMVAWGTSFSGGHALFAAQRSPDVAAVISQVPLTDGGAETEVEIPWKAMWPLIRLSFMDKRREHQDGERFYVRAVCQTGEVCLMPGPEAVAGLEVLAADSTWPNVVTPGLLLDADEYFPNEAAKSVTVPTLFVVAERDIYVPNSATYAVAEIMPLAEVVTLDAGHFDVYSGPAFQESMSAQLAFLERVFGETP